MHDKINNEYFEWMFDLVSNRKYMGSKPYRKLLMILHSRTFRYPSNIPNDGNRAEDGVRLRYRFAREQGYKDISPYLLGPCSILEMMIALAIRCEEHIMEDTDIGNRTGKWFWDMIDNLGLYYMDDEHFDKVYVAGLISRFLDRKYRDDGEGGLFTVRNCPYDLRNVEIWYQMCWYLNNFI